MPQSDTPAPHERLAVATGGRPGVLGVDIQIGRHRLRADEPIAAGGGATGPDPFEYLLAGLGACTAMTIRMYADRKGWALDRVDVWVSEAREADAATGRRVFEREVRLEGELSEAERERLLEIAERCPVSRALAAGVTLRARLADGFVGEATS